MCASSNTMHSTGHTMLYSTAQFTHLHEKFKQTVTQSNMFQVLSPLIGADLSRDISCRNETSISSRERVLIFWSHYSCTLNFKLLALRRTCTQKAFALVITNAISQNNMQITIPSITSAKVKSQVHRLHKYLHTMNAKKSDTGVV